MSTRQLDGQIHNNDNTDIVPTSSSQNIIISNSDTILLTTQRSINSSSSGFPGEFCFGTVNAVTYLYYCIAENSWQRVALSAW